MPFTVKATYRAQTRKLSFPECNTFPSFDQLYHQLYRVFPISHPIILSKLLFSPDSSHSRLLISRELRTAEEYALAVAPYTGRAWTAPLLRFSVFDETPHKLPAISHTPQNQASHPQKPEILNPFPVAEPSFGRISYSHIPPPPIIFSSRPTQETIDVGNLETTAKPTVQQREPALCCSVAQTKKEIQELISSFKVDLDRALSSLDSHAQRNPISSAGFADALSPKIPPQVIPSVPSPELVLPSVPMYPPLCQYNLCWSCGVLKQGPWFDCANCTSKLCVTCLENARISDCFSGSPHVWKKQTCKYCVPSATPVLTPSPLQGTSWGSVPLNSFGSPLLPSVPTMPPSVREEATKESPSSLNVPFAVPVAESVSVRNEDNRVVHHDVWCDSCHSVIEGIRHKCLDCPDFDLCTPCIRGVAAETHNPFHEFFQISEPGRVVVHNVFSGRGEQEVQQPPPRPVDEVPVPPPQPVVHSATCDLCESRIYGDRYKCVTCPDWDCCENCFTITEEQHPRHAFVKITRPADYIRRDTTVDEAHFATCNSCSRHIYGIRYKCMHEDCPDFDLCSVCEALPIAVHPAHHPLLKIKEVETVIPTVYRNNSRVDAVPVNLPGPPPVTPRAPSPFGDYESGFMRNPGLHTDDVLSPEMKPPSPFYFQTQSVRSLTPEYQPSEIDQRPTAIPAYNLPSVSARSPSPAMMPGALPTFFNLPPIESLSLSSMLNTPPTTLPSIQIPQRPQPVEEEEPEGLIRTPSPLWKHTPYTRSRAPLAIPGQYLSDSHRLSLSPKPASEPLVAPSANPKPTSPLSFSEWRKMYGHKNSFPDNLLSEVESTSRAPSPVQSTVEPGFWPENFQEIRHLMGEEPSFSRDLHQSAESRLPVEESPLILESEPLLARPPSSRSLSNTDRSLRSLTSILSGIQISPATRSVTAPEPKESLTGTLNAPVVRSESLTSSLSSSEPLNAEFVADRTLACGQVLAPGAEFSKAWVMRNSGSKSWPAGTQLVFVAGESLGKDNTSMQPQAVGIVQPDEQIDVWTGELKAPGTPGRYVSYYRLRDDEGNLFGHNLWLDISVSQSSQRDTPETSTSSEGYLSSSSIMVMPQRAPTPSAASTDDQRETVDETAEGRSPDSSVPVSPMTARSVDDEVEISDADSDTTGSLLSVPDSDSDEELWQDSRTSVHFERQEAQESQATMRVAQPSDEYVVLYDDATSSEEED
ncbi:hypothetical protein C8R42DRAFT_668536 [Lentinula raphanica]|nr:hypothetical protein C8R42DRAFT_668536 [Lentinula raphanica]